MDAAVASNFTTEPFLHDTGTEIGRGCEGLRVLACFLPQAARRNLGAWSKKDLGNLGRKQAVFEEPRSMIMVRGDATS